MSNLATIQKETSLPLPVLIERAANALASAKNAGEILEALAVAAIAYDAAKNVSRIGKARKAHDEIVAAAHRAQADALIIEAAAKRRLADEYDAAQERGEVQAHGGQGRKDIPIGNVPKVSDIGLSPKTIHEARIIRDAEEVDPGIVKRTLDEALEHGEEPTRAKVKRAVIAKSKRARRPRVVDSGPVESQHDRDLRMLLGVWEASCESAKESFLKQIQTGR